MTNRRWGRRDLVGRGALALAGLLAAPAAVRAQDFPIKPVHIVVPFAAGGGSDIVARLIGAGLSERWKQPVVVENKPGASGLIGSDAVAKAAPDGHALLVTTNAHVINPYTIRSLPYDTEKSFTPITPLILVGVALVGSTKAGMDSMETVLKHARASPAAIQWGSSENATRMSGELFRMRSGLRMEHVAYKGGAPMLQDLVGGHIPIGIASPLAAMSFQRAGTVKMLAVTTEKRLPAIPDVPTMAEAGIPDMVRPAWFGLFAPAGLPPAIRQRIHADVVAVMATPEVRARITALASEPGGEPPHVFAARIRTELALWGEVARAAGIQPE